MLCWDRHKIIFVTGPNVPNASLSALVAWGKAGGMIVTTSSAATTDELDQPSAILTGASGLSSVHNGRTPRGDHQLGPFGPAMKAGTATPAPGMNVCAPSHCHFTALGEAGSFVNQNGSDIASWVGSSGGGAATRWAELGTGVHVHFAWLPGVTHTFSGRGPDEATVSAMLANLTQAVGVTPPVTVSVPWIEAPLLHGPEGSVVSLLNWTDHGQDDTASSSKSMLDDPRGSSQHRDDVPPVGATIQLNVTLGFEPASVTSVKCGALPMTKLGNGIVGVTLPLGAADFLLFRK